MVVRVPSVVRVEFQEPHASVVRPMLQRISDNLLVVRTCGNHIVTGLIIPEQFTVKAHPALFEGEGEGEGGTCWSYGPAEII